MKEQLKIVLIGLVNPWHHVAHLRRFFQHLKADIEIINPTSFPNPFFHAVSIDADVDYVFVFQFAQEIHIIKGSEKTRIIQFCGEIYWHPSCQNPDFLIIAFPEMLDRYKFQYPGYFKTLKGYMEDRMYIDPSMFQPTAPKKAGIFFQGPTIGGRGPHEFRAYRVGYQDRSNFLHEVHDLITILPSDYKSDYGKVLSGQEAHLVIHGLDAYMSKRPLENMAAGVINILYLKDNYQILYYEKLGFKHMENCYFVLNRFDVQNFSRLTAAEKQTIRANALKLVHDRFTLHTMWNEWVKWMDSCELKEAGPQ